MRIAICFNGQIRTGVQCANNIKHYIGNLFPNCDFFIHTWDNETTKPFSRTHWNGIALAEPRPDILLCPQKLEQFINIYNPINYKVDKYSEFINDKTYLPPVWYTSVRSFKLMHDYELANNFTYDLVIKIRPDILFPLGRSLGADIAHLNLSNPIIYSDPYTTNRLDDVFWVTNSAVTKVMTDLIHVMLPNDMTYNEMILQFLNEASIKLKPLTKSNLICYTIYRQESYMLDPITNFRECFMNDIIHYSNVPDKELIENFNHNDITHKYG